ncbi:TonB-dependent receptor, partial [uncultured Chryseobacterium sp.]|uniref:TonB-dependent receptor domain-containing protein n=1 Tax=uncultured Chryseobacterium sp. TaxID=259322 RepID=UPI00263677BB
AAQFTAALGADFKVTDWFSFDAQYRYADNLYSAFEPQNRTTETSAAAVKLPAYGLLDAGVGFKLPLNATQGFKFRFNVNNVLDKVYIAESRTNIAADTNPANNWNGINKNNEVFFGFGRTWNASATFNF